MFKKIVNFFVSIFAKPKPETKNIGNMGEDLATKFLKQKGYKILKRNFRSKNNEIDIISQHQNVLVFVEVKTRTNTAKVSGYFSAVGKRKKIAVRTCAKDYIATLKRKPKTWRFDAVEVNYDPNNKAHPDIRHYENVY